MNQKIDLTPLIGRVELRRDVKILGARIAEDYVPLVDSGDELTVVVVLGGAFMFAADLVRAIDLPMRVEFVKVKSYEYIDHGKLNRQLWLQRAVKPNEHVLIVEDIVDTGRTAKYLLDAFNETEAASVKLCALLDKQERREITVEIDYAVKQIGDSFIVGYGLDLNGKYRNLPDVCQGAGR